MSLRDFFPGVCVREREREMGEEMFIQKNLTCNRKDLRLCHIFDSFVLERKGKKETPFLHSYLNWKNPHIVGMFTRVKHTQPSDGLIRKRSCRVVIQRNQYRWQRILHNFASFFHRSINNRQKILSLWGSFFPPKLLIN